MNFKIAMITIGLAMLVSCQNIEKISTPEIDKQGESVIEDSIIQAEVLNQSTKTVIKTYIDSKQYKQIEMLIKNNPEIFESGDVTRIDRHPEDPDLFLVQIQTSYADSLYLLTLEESQLIESKLINNSDCRTNARFVYLDGFDHYFIQYYESRELSAGSFNLYSLDSSTPSIQIIGMFDDYHERGIYESIPLQRVSEYFSFTFKDSLLNVSYDDVNQDGYADFTFTGTQQLYGEEDSLLLEEECKVIYLYNPDSESLKIHFSQSVFPKYWFYNKFMMDYLADYQIGPMMTIDTSEVKQAQKDGKITIEREEPLFELSFTEDKFNKPVDINKLQKYIPVGCSIYQGYVSDLDLDGKEDLILSLIPLASDIDGDELIIMILKGFGNDTYEVIKQNNHMMFRTDRGKTQIEAGTGWFKLYYANESDAGDVSNQLFQYDRNKNDWFLAENYYGITSEEPYGEVIIATPDNYGVLPFDHYNFRSNISFDVYQEEDTKVMRYDISFEDKEKESRISSHIRTREKIFLNSFNKVENMNFAYENITYYNPNIISLEYSINEKKFSILIDEESEEMINLSDIIEEKYYQIIAERMKESGYSGSNNPDDRDHKVEESIDEIISLLQNADNPETMFSSGSTRLYTVIYEGGLCLNFKQKDSGGSSEEVIKWYFINSDELALYLKRDYWRY